MYIIIHTLIICPRKSVKVKYNMPVSIESISQFFLYTIYSLRKY